MSPDTVIRMLQRHGESLVLKRAGQPDLTVKAKRGSFSTDSVAGSMDDAAETIRISNAEISGSGAPTQFPRKGDTIGGFVILSCDTRKAGEQVALHVLHVGGGT